MGSSLWRCQIKRGETVMTKTLQGKVAAVTGAASGIGLASAEAMIAAGARVVLIDRDEKALQAICSKHGDSAVPLIIDLLNPEHARRCLTAFSQRRTDSISCMPTQDPISGAI